MLMVLPVRSRLLKLDATGRNVHTGLGLFNKRSVIVLNIKKGKLFTLRYLRNALQRELDRLSIPHLNHSTRYTKGLMTDRVGFMFFWFEYNFTLHHLALLCDLFSVCLCGFAPSLFLPHKCQQLY